MYDHVTEWSFSLRNGVMPRARVVLGVRVSRVLEVSVEVGPRVAVEFEENPDVLVDDGQSAERCCECPVSDEREETDGVP